MIDYIPPDVPPVVVKYADRHPLPNSFAKYRYLIYFTPWHNGEIYLMGWGDDQPRETGLPIPVFYDCQTVRELTLEERREFKKEWPKHINDRERPHACNKD